MLREKVLPRRSTGFQGWMRKGAVAQQDKVPFRLVKRRKEAGAMVC